MPARPLGRLSASIGARLLRAGPVSLALLNGGGRLTWSAQPDPPFTTVLALRIGAHDFEILLDDLGVVPELAPQVMRTLSDSERLVAANFALGPLLAALQLRLARPVALDAVSYRRTTHCPAESLGFLLEETASGLVRRGCIVPKDQAAWSLLDTLTQALPESTHFDPEAVVTARLLLGGTRLKLSEHQRIGTGWVIVVHALAAGERGFTLVTDEGDAHGAFRVERGSRLAHRIDMRSIVKLSVLDGLDGSADGIDEVELDIGFELGRTRVGLTALRGFTPGQVLELDRPIEDCSIQIRCGNRVIGTGELVDLDGTLGVRVLTIDRRE